MKNRKILQVEELERRNTPSCSGLQNALASPGAAHRSDAAQEQLQHNMALQCSDSGHTPGQQGGGVTSDGLIQNHNETLVRDRKKRTKTRK